MLAEQGVAVNVQTDDIQGFLRDEGHFGLAVAPQKSILVPTAHDEPAIHLGIYQEVLALPAAYALAPLVVVTQTLVELVLMVVLVRLVPRIVRES